MTRKDFLSGRLDFFQRIARSFLNSRRNSSIRARLRLGASLTVLALVPTAALAQSATSDAAGAPYPRFFLDPATFDDSWTPPAGAGSAASPAPAADAQAAGASAQPKSIPANPNAFSGLISSQILQKSLGLPLDAPLQVGGEAAFVGNRLTSGGLKTFTDSGERWFGFNADLDMERLFPFASIPGGELYSSMIQYEGGRGLQYVGSVQGYDGVNAWGAGKYGRDRLELYEVWWRQRLFDDRLIAKVGKINGAAEFAQVLNPPTIPQDPSRMAWTISDLLFSPAGYLPIFQGKLPVYANPAWGATVTVQPTPAVYGRYGFFDGNNAQGRETGPRLGPDLNENIFQIAEGSLSWELGEERKAGRVAAGVWKQTGLLPTGMLDLVNGGLLKEHDARGVYAVASQRLWYLTDTDSRGLVGYAQFGYSPSQTSEVQHYLGGGLTALGLIPTRYADTISFGFAWSRLNQGPIAGIAFGAVLTPPWGWTSSPYAWETRLNSTERMFQVAYRLNLVPGKIVLDAGYTAIPNPGYRPGIPWANVFTVRTFLVF
jgi:porin